MRSWPDVSTGRRTRPSFWTSLQDAVDEIEGGEVALPLAGIEEALGEYGAVAAAAAPTRSQSLRGQGTTPVWLPSESILLEDFGGSSNGVTDNATVLASAVAQAVADGTSARTGAPIRLLRGTYLTSSPVVLPRTGSTPTSVVQLLGSNIRSTILQGTSGFPTDRAVIEWEATTARVWHQCISNMTIKLPSVAGTKAIWYKRNGTRPATNYNQYSDERMGCMEFSNLLIEGSNRYNEVLIDLEGSIFYSSFLNLFGDPSRTNSGNEYDAPYSTLLLRGSHGYNADEADAPYSTIDSPGFWNCTLRGLYGMTRRGGYSRTFEGRLTTSVMEQTFGNGGLPGTITYWFLNCSNSVVRAIGTEGYADTGIQIDKGHLFAVTDMRLGGTNSVFPVWAASTAFAAGTKVMPTDFYGANTSATRGHYYESSGGTSGGSEPTWPTSGGGTVSDGTITWTEQGYGLADSLVINDSADVFIERRLTGGNSMPNSQRGQKFLTINSGSTRVKVNQFLVRKPSGGAVTDEYTDDGTDSTLEILEASTIGTIGGGDF